MPRRLPAVERTNQILDAAISEFARLGFEGARMDDIARAAGLSKGSLYLHFKSKDALIEGLLDRIFTDNVALLDSLVASNANATGLIPMLFRGMAMEMAQLKPLLPIWFEFYAIAGRAPAIRDRLAGHFARFRGALAAVVERGVASGEFRPVPAEDVAIVIAAELEGIAILWAVDPASVDPERHLQSACDLLLAALQSHGEPHA